MRNSKGAGLEKNCTRSNEDLNWFLEQNQPLNPIDKRSCKWKMKKVCLSSAGNCACSKSDDINMNVVPRQSTESSTSTELHNHSSHSSETSYQQESLHPYNRFYSEVQSVAKVTSVLIEREEDTHTLGITLRGGAHPTRPLLSRSLTITKIAPGGPVDKEGTIHVGDRLLAVNGHSLENVCLSEAQEILQSCQDDKNCRLTIEYDVSVMSALRLMGTPLLVEIECPQLYQLGLTFTNTVRNSAILIEDVKVGSIAERCGALFPGDTILSVNDSKVEGTKMAAVNIHHLFHQYCKSEDVLRLEILPAPPPNQKLYDDSIFIQNSERMCIEIQCDETGDLGLTVVTLDDQLNLPVIYQIDSSSPADRSERLKCSDRILLINGAHPPYSKTPMKLCDFRPHETVRLDVEYDVEKCTASTFGTFSVQITKRSDYDLGLSLASSDLGPVIVEVRAGSPAKRSGAILVGDVIVAVNDHLLDSTLTMDEVYRILAIPAQQVTLLLHRHSQQYCCEENIVRTVHLKRNGGPLGITIAGSEDPKDPILISSLAPDGVAQQTRALHVGDQLVAIDGQSLHCKPLSAAITSLQQAGDSIVLKVVRHPVFDQEQMGSRADEIYSSYRSYDQKPNCNNNRDSPNFLSSPSGLITNDDSFESFLQLSDPSLNDVSTYNLPDIYSWPHSRQPPDLTTFASNTNRGHRKNKPNQVPNGFRMQNYAYDMCKVTLLKDAVYDDFGFSISDGLYERGVFINRMRPGGPAERSQVLRPYDRIIQVNETRTDDFDCCMTVPLIAAAGDRITLSVARRKHTGHFHHYDCEENKILLPWVEDEPEEEISLQGPWQIKTEKI
nr:PREDICTED: glutamate receptor-interacting protein 2 [Bemisia tabaci]